MILWHTDTDEIIRGQWVHHRVYEHNCLLSFDGELLVYHAYGPYKSKNSSKRIEWTAVSRPPFFTALAMWNYHLGNLVVYKDSPSSNEPPPHPSKLASMAKSPAEHLKQTGWERVGGSDDRVYPHESIWQKTHRRSKSSLVMRSHFGFPNHIPGRGTQSEDYSICRQADGAETALENVDWADIDHKQRLVFTREGRLYAAEILPDGLRETLLADFTTDQPTKVAPPPWAKRWPRH
ncbi:MAG TPA: hypothetical protein VM008_05705 [Phycisphaerae bacterium]|nr:hypothetical protein [Phycisphaerae bacterium]